MFFMCFLCVGWAGKGSVIMQECNKKMQTNVWGCNIGFNIHFRPICINDMHGIKIATNFVAFAFICCTLLWIVWLGWLTGLPQPALERLAIEALQLCTLLLPPVSRRKLQLLLRMISRMSQNVDMPRLHDTIGTRTLVRNNHLLSCTSSGNATDSVYTFEIGSLCHL